METENKIINLFIEENIPKTIREISKKIKSDYKITHTATQRLLEKSMLISKKIGQSSLCELNNSFYSSDIYAVENKRKDNLLKNKNLKQLYQEVITKIESVFFIFTIFGSYASRKQTKSSDIDILFVSNEQGFEEKVSNILSLLPIKTHPFVFTEDEFIRMKDSKKSNIIKEMIKNNIILYGVENYYRLKNT